MRVKLRFKFEDDDETVVVTECDQVYKGPESGRLIIINALEEDQVSTTPIFESDYKHIMEELLVKGYCDLTPYTVFEYDENDEEQENNTEEGENNQ